MRLNFILSDAQAEHLIAALEAAETAEGVDYYDARPVTVLVEDAITRARRVEQRKK